MPVSVRLAVFALVFNGLLGLALLFDTDVPSTMLAAMILGFVALDIAALAAVAWVARKRLPAWTVLGLTAWFIGLIAGVIFASWVCLLLTSDTPPTWSPGETWVHIEAITRALGQGIIVWALFDAARRRGMGVAAIAWLVLTVVQIGVQVKFLSSTDIDAIERYRIVREVAYSGALGVFAWLVVVGERELRERDLAPARVVV
jgi:hypothetical protein